MLTSKRVLAMQQGHWKAVNSILVNRHDSTRGPMIVKPGNVKFKIEDLS